MADKMIEIDIRPVATIEDSGEILLSARGHDDHSDKGDSSAKQDAILFSDALALTNFGKFNYFLIFISGMVLANVLLETTAISFVLPIAECDLKMTNEDKGILSAISFVGIIVSSHLWGFLADTKGRRRVIRPTLLAGFIVTVFSSFSQTFWMMVLLRFVNGFFVSGGSATIYAYLGEFHIDKTRSRAMMFSSFIYALGAMILPIIAFIVINQDWLLHIPLLGIDYKPWRLFIIVCGVPGFLSGLSLFALPESPRFLLSMGQEQKTVEVLQKMHRWNGNKGELKISRILPEEDVTCSMVSLNKPGVHRNEVIAFMQTMWNQTTPLFNRRYLRITLIVCNMQFWLYAVMNGLYMWFPHIINSMVEFMNAHPGEHKQICQIMYDKQESLYKTDGTIECITKLENTTYFYSLMLEILYASSFALIGLVINRVGEKAVLFVTTIFFPACGLAAVFIANPSLSAYLYVLFFATGVAINVLGAATVELYPTNLRAMAICISLMFGRLGSVVGAYATGALLENYCEFSFYIVCPTLFVCAFSSLLIPNKSSSDEPEKATIEQYGNATLTLQS